MPGKAAPMVRRSSSGSPRRRIQISTSQPTAPVAGKRHDQRGDAPAVHVKRPRFLDVAQPQPLDLGRYAFEPLQAVRPHQRMECREDDSGGDAPAPAAASSRPERAARGHRAGRRRAAHRTATPVTVRRTPLGGCRWRRKSGRRARCFRQARPHKPASAPARRRREPRTTPSPRRRWRDRSASRARSPATARVEIPSVRPPRSFFGSAIAEMLSASSASCQP